MAGYDLDRDGMLGLIDEFIDRLSAGTIAVVYFSGHGVQIGGQNYLLPIDVSAESRTFLMQDGYPLGTLVEQITATRARFSLAIVDACRDNPFPISVRSLGTTRGLAPTTASGAMIVYSAGANQQAIDNLGVTDPDPNGLFTREFLKAIAIPGVSVRDAISRVKIAVATAADSIGLKQTPAIYDEATGDFIFTPGTVKIEVTVTPATVVARPSTSQPRSPPAPGIMLPSDSAMSLDDLAASDAAAKVKWDAWQARMQADFTRVTAFQGSAEGRRAAWDRFLAAYADQNPYSSDDEGLRQQAISSRAAIEDATKLALAASPATPRPDASSGGPAGRVFHDCADCPEMVVIPAGEYVRGSPEAEPGRFAVEGPLAQVTIASAFAVGKFEVTFEEWDGCVAAGGCRGYRPADRWGRGRQPVNNVSWDDANAYVAWLSGITGKPYRLLSEAEWEYAARAGTTTPYATGLSITAAQANFAGGHSQVRTVGSYPANPFGLHDMLGNLSEWTEDCWNGSYGGAPANGSAWTAGNCSERVQRGGSWLTVPSALRSAKRLGESAGWRSNVIGFRVARTLF
jgi:formylglycine-generating enzyme required for sulfatase activity